MTGRDPAGTGEAGFTPPATDPWKGLRGVMAGTLILEVIVMILTFPIVARIGGGLTWYSTLYLGLVALALLAAAGMQRRRHALEINLGLQVAVIAGGVFHWSIAVVGVIFGCVWLYVRYVKLDVERRMRAGMLPGQHPVGDRESGPTGPPTE